MPTTIPVKLILFFYVLKKKFRKERELAIESWARVTTLICYRATETENNDENRPITYMGTRGEYIHEVLLSFNHKRTMIISIGH